MPKILVVEDNIKEYELCKELILKITPEMDIIHASSGEEALDILSNDHCDGIFIDVGLPRMNGFKLATKIRSMIPYHVTPLVFITGVHMDAAEIMKDYNNYAYITKPYTPEVFSSTVSSLLKCILYAHSEESEPREPRILISSEGSYHVIPTNTILYAEVYQKHLTLYTQNNIYRNIVIPLSKFIANVNDPFFIKCHRAFAVNIRHVDNLTINSKKSYDIVMEHGEAKVPLSLLFKKDVLHLLNIRNGGYNNT